MRRALAAVAGLAVCAVVLAMNPPESVGAPARGRSAAASADPLQDSPIEHVVIVYQENHTFDDALGAVCETRTTPCDGYTGPVTMADGITAENVVMPDVIPVVAHDPIAQRQGLRNRWDHVVGCAMPPHYCVSHVERPGIPNLADLADRFTVSDATFAAGHAASFGAHVTLGAGTFDRFLGFNPVKLGHGKARPGWGCSSHLDALWGPRRNPTYEPSCIPDQQGRGPYRASRVPYAPTVMERMEAAGRSWHIYEGDHKYRPALTPFSICTYFAWCARKRFELEWDSSYADFYQAAADGTLPNLSILIPDSGNSQHNGLSMLKGDNYIGSLVTAVENGPDWESTVVFITYDDCGCFYDHVTPPTPAYGMRNPMVIVSPWAKPTGTDSTLAVQPYSMLAFVQHTFGLRPLTDAVSQAYDYADSFDFSQPPLPGIAMTRTPVPRSEWPELRRLRASVQADPT